MSAVNGEPGATGEPGASAPGVWGKKWRIAWVVLVLAGGVAIWFAFMRSTGDDLSRLQGDWHYSTAGRNNLGVIRVEGETWSYYSGGPNGRSYRITLRPDASPKEIDLTLLGDDGNPATFTHGAGKGGEVKLLGVYSFSGSELKVALGVNARPKGFEDEEAQVLVLTRLPSRASKREESP